MTDVSFFDRFTQSLRSSDWLEPDHRHSPRRNLVFATVRCLAVATFDFRSPTLPRSATINVMANAALKAARGLIRDFGEVEQLQVSVKGPGDFVSAADLKAQRALRAELGKARPGYGFLMEESGAEAGSDGHHRWIVDPLDGTTNFLHGIPHFSISIGLERDQEMIAGLIYEPVRDEMFWAEKGAGAFLNDRRMRVSARRTLGEALIGTGIPFVGRGDHQSYLATLGAVMAATSGVRRLGVASLDLAYVAAGRLDGFWEFNLQPWDLAAGLLVVREAGGYVSDAAAGQGMLATGDVVAANDYLHPLLVQLLKKALQAPVAN
jgi:myo-inositol-1(or 4)-monophosphatase